MGQWGGNLSVLAGHRTAPGALEAIVALGDRLRLEEDMVRKMHGESARGG